MTTDRWPDQATAYAAGREDAVKDLLADAEQREAKKLTRTAIKRMKPDEINARWAEVQEVLAQGNAA